MVEDAMTNPTSAMDKELIMWNDLSPAVSECLQRYSPPPKKARNLPCHSKCDQACEHPGRCAEQKGDSPAIPKCCSEGGKERVEGKGNNDAINA